MKKPTFILSTFILLSLFSICKTVSGQEKGAKEKKGNEVTKYERANAEYMLVEAQKFFLLEDYERALAFLDQSLEVDKNNHAAYFKKGEINLIQGNYKEALKAVKKAQTLQPENKYYYILAAQIDKADNQLASAAKEYEAMIEKSTDYREFLLDLADVYVALEEYGKALETLNLTEEQYNTPHKFATQKKELLLKDGRENEALALFKNLTEQYPLNEDYKLQYANLLAESGNKEEATEILSTTNDSGASTFRLIDLKLESNDFEDAKPLITEVFENKEADLAAKISLVKNLSSSTNQNIPISFIDDLQKKLYTLNPKDINVIKAGEVVYSNLALKANGVEKAAYESQTLHALNQLKELNPSDFEVWNKLLKRAYEQKTWSSLLKDSDEALGYYPNQGLFYFYFGSAQMYSSNGDKEEAKAAFEQASRLARNDEDLQNRIKTKREELANQKSQPKEETAKDAIPNFDKNNRDSDAWRTLLRYVETHNTPDATERTLALLNGLLEDQPKNHEILETKAKVLFQIGRFAEARQAIELSLTQRIADGFEQLNEDSVEGETLEFYGDVLIQLNLVDEAVEQWKKAKKLGNTSDKIDKKIADKKYYK